MNNQVYSINEIKDRIQPIAKAYGVDAMYLFGSYARGTAKSDSDLDFRIDKGRVRGLSFARLYCDLEDALDKPIDLVTTNSLDDGFKNSIAEEEVLIYAR